MSLLKHSLYVVAIYATAFCGVCRAENFYQPEAIDNNLSNAILMFWQSFDEYEKIDSESNKKNYQESWRKLKEDRASLEEKAKSEKKTTLLRSIDSYRASLSNYPEAKNRPYVMMNLAHALILFSGLDGDADTRQPKLDEAIEILKSLIASHPRFEHLDTTYYLLAIAQSQLKLDELALNTWKKLSEYRPSSIYVAHAQVALGDYEFNRDQPSRALVLYKKAINTIQVLNKAEFDFELLRAEYRGIWAAYRSADLNLVFDLGASILSPGRAYRNLSELSKIEKDTITILGDATFENGDVEEATAVITNPRINKYSAAIALRLMQRYNAESFSEGSIKIGSLVMNKYFVQFDAPLAIKLLSDAYEKIGNSDKAIDVLSSIALIISPNSLWIQKNKNRAIDAKDIIELAKASAIKVANYHYQKGMASGSSIQFNSASQFYTLLSSQYPHDPQYTEWSMKLGHSLYFANQYKKSLSTYESLKTQKKLTSDELEITSYQAVLAQEKIWQEALSSSSSEKSIKTSLDQVGAELNTLEQVVEDFVNKHPLKERGNDVLLVAANAFRDSGNYEKARLYWSRSLNSKPTIAQRRNAIRGLVMASIKLDLPEKLIETTSNFLILEDWNSLSTPLANELLGVMATALDNFADQNKKTAKLELIAAQFTKNALRFPNLPRREQFLRDGGYWYAIAGNWSAASKTADSYLNEKLKQFEPDMMYLKARALEYQMRFTRASEAYYRFASSYQKHPKSLTALNRSLNLATAEGDWQQAALSAELLADLSAKEDRGEKLKLAFSYFQKRNDDKGMERIKKKLASTSATLEDKLVAQLIVVKSELSRGYTEKAIRDLNSMNTTLTRRQDALSKDGFSSLSAEVNLLLAKDLIKEWNQISQNQDMNSPRINKKSALFEKIFASLEKSSAANDRVYSYEARYLAASLAEELANEMREVANLNSDSISLATTQKFKDNAKRFAEMSKKLHSINVSRSAGSLSSRSANQWAKKSSLALTGGILKNSNDDANNSSIMVGLSPSAMDFDFPMQWSNL